jgi:hypothetical protein
MAAHDFDSLKLLTQLADYRLQRGNLDPGGIDLEGMKRLEEARLYQWVASAANEALTSDDISAKDKRLVALYMKRFETCFR